MRMAFIVFGLLFLLGAFFLVFVGVTSFLVNGVLTASDRFPTGDLTTSSYAIIVKNIDIHVDQTGLWTPNPSDILTIRLSGSSNDPSKRVFIGIAEESNVTNYLRSVEYDEITDLRVEGDLFQGFRLTVSYTRHSGLELPPEPTSMYFWVVSASGANTQTLSWTPGTGTYWIVLMNDDGSAQVDVKVGVGAEVPFLSTIALGSSIGGAVLFIIGTVLLYLGVHTKGVSIDQPATSL